MTLKKRNNKILDKSITELGLSVRTTNALEEHKLIDGTYGEKILTVRKLLQQTREGLLRIQNVGDKTLDEVFECLAQEGFHRVGCDPKLEDSDEERRRYFEEMFCTDT